LTTSLEEPLIDSIRKKFCLSLLAKTKLKERQACSWKQAYRCLNKSISSHINKLFRLLACQESDEKVNMFFWTQQQRNEKALFWATGFKLFLKSKETCDLFFIT